MARSSRKAHLRHAVALLCLLAGAPALVQLQDTATDLTDVQNTMADVAQAQNTAAGAAQANQATGATGAVQSGQALEDALEANSEAQDYNEATKPIKAQVVKEDPAFLIATGTGDIDTTGRCQTEVDKFCFEVKPGEGRLAKCLQQQIEEQGKANSTEPKVSPACAAELDKFLISRAENINADLPLAKACVGDADKLCKNLGPDVTVLGCLREKVEQLSSECKAEVFERQTGAANDWRTDTELYKACETDANTQCSTVDPHEGKMQQCLREHRSLLTWDCQEELFRQEVENSDDLRLSVRLFKVCLTDKKKFCADVQPGNARAKECLEENRDKDGFSAECKTEIEKMMSERAADFRLDSKLRTLCQDDIADMCGYERDSLDSVAGSDARVIQCLQDYRDEIVDDGCKARIQKVMEFASSDIRFDVPLAMACYDDRQDFCGKVPPGSARVIRCLQERREELSYECKATLFDQEVSMSENIDFQYPMKQACTGAIKTFCKDIPHGHARVIRCLQENLENPAMPKECREKVNEYSTKSASDYRLNFRLSTACHDTIADKCSDACSSNSIEKPCGGTVLRCLSDKIEEITNNECKKEVFYFQKMEVTDFRNDVILAETCRNDVDTYCASTPAGEGRVHKCLWDNKDKISKQCRAEELKLLIMQSSNTELMPNLSKACKEERSLHCKGVRPGKSRVYNCLLNNADSVGFSPACKTQLTQQQSRRVRDYRMDYDLKTGCKNDVPKVCAGEFKEEDKETGAVLRCLVKNVDVVSDTCTREVSRAIRATLQLYQPALPVIEACDADVKNLCTSQKGLEAHTVGEIRQCLISHIQVPTPPGTDAKLRHLLEEVNAATGVVAGTGVVGALSPECEAVVQLAEPGDAFKAFTASMNASAIASSVRSIEQKLGFKEGTLTPRDASGMLTLTGWSAMLGLVALITVIIGGGIWGYRRYHGLDGVKGYIKVVKGKAPEAGGLEMKG